MQPSKNNSNNFIIFIAISIVLLLSWEYFFPKPKPAETNNNQKIVEQTNQQNSNKNININSNTNTNTKLDNQLKLIFINTDNYKAGIDLTSGDLKNLDLIKYHDIDNNKTEFKLLEDSTNNKYFAQTGIIENNKYILNDTPFNSTITKDNDKTRIILSKPEINGIQLKKIYTFHNNSYLIDITYEIYNNSPNPLNLSSMYRLIRDNHEPKGGTMFTHTYTGPVIYTSNNKNGNFEKIEFSDLDKNDVKYPNLTKNGWLGFSQHYFSTVWLLNTKNNELCSNTCYIDISKRINDNLYSVGFLKNIPTIEPKQSVTITAQLFAGPQEYNALKNSADNLLLIKDYGKAHIFASPLFWLLQEIHNYIGNWGWAIIILVILIKIILFPLNNASFKSMARMSKVAPKLKELKDIYGDDKMKMQQEMMTLYKKEKINPLGGCLPMILQIPIFIGLYWALFNSVELKEAPWIGWITDLSKTDPYYILPIIMALTMFLQTFLNPPPADPLQARMMKIMPIVFSFMFFFFPAGLVLYWVVNNILTILQQWIIKKNIAKKEIH